MSVSLELTPQASARKALTCRLTLPVTSDHDRGADLSVYMALPVSQYVLIDVPLGAKLRRIGTDLFKLAVPRLELFGLWLQPQVECIVRYWPNNHLPP